jgi:flagellar hook assembly protein FlgD
VKLSILNILGQEVKHLVNSVQDAGYRFVEWNSTNDVGNSVASGVYFYRIDIQDIYNNKMFHSEVKKMVLVR